jgi:citrate synthase
MLRSIRDDGVSVQDYLNKVKNRSDHTKLMGFGHRIYKNYDPRAAIIKKHADAILKSRGGTDQLLDIALELEEAALSDDYFVERKLYPNVDFYTGLIYQAMGFPVDMFTVLFALGRLPGWIAQWREMVSDPTTKIGGDPRQIYGNPPHEATARASDTSRVPQSVRSRIERPAGAGLRPGSRSTHAAS